MVHGAMDDPSALQPELQLINLLQRELPHATHTAFSSLSVAYNDPLLRAHQGEDAVFCAPLDTSKLHGVAEELRKKAAELVTLVQNEVRNWVSGETDRMCSWLDNLA